MAGGKMALEAPFLGSRASGSSSHGLAPLETGLPSGADSVSGGGDGGLSPLEWWLGFEVTRVAPSADGTLLEGMDLKTSYLLKIKLIGNPKKARKDFRSFCFERAIDSDTINFKNLVKSIVDQYPLGYMEVSHVQYYDEPIAKWLFEEPMQKQPKNCTQLDENRYLQNPLLENEYVGVHDEVIYLTNEPVADVNAVVISDKGKNMEYVSEEDKAKLEVEEEELVAEKEDKCKSQISSYWQDMNEDPPITIGTIYPNMEEFKLALSQYAIKYEFEYRTKKSAPSRFRGYCA
ncbi:hypothetical protein BAE44_0017915 [Dichanthelium oligosanthes]|uniref:Transposase MuDR plant domain-containing protein n=1 Tax=Dichanthelium oligosanthes TaxID=888268 RepID=A0A1E5V7N9_9POAL|nr:hypothetical protein BAE44_0017915 [Dichanthelium oligosanthes]